MPLSTLVTKIKQIINLFLTMDKLGIFLYQANMKKANNTMFEEKHEKIECWRMLKILIELKGIVVCVGKKKLANNLTKRR